MAPFRKLVLLGGLQSHIAFRTFYGRSKYHGIGEGPAGGSRCVEKMVRGGPAKRTVKRAKIFALAKSFGAQGRSKNCYSLAVRKVQKTLEKQYVERKKNKREMRSLWITRINIASRGHHVPYSIFMNQLTRNNIQLNRKMLSELAIHEPRTFKAFAEFAQKRHKDGLRAALN